MNGEGFLWGVNSTSAKLGQLLQTAGGAVLLLAIVAAPWMYGSTRHWAIVTLATLLSVAVGAWLLGMILEYRRPEVSRIVLWVAGFLLVSGWGMTLYGTGLPPDPFVKSHFVSLAMRWPGSFVLKTPVEAMWLFTGLLGALSVSADLARSQRWGKALFVCMANTGASCSLLGIVQAYLGAPGILWQVEPKTTGYFFGTFFHYSVGGAFANLTWPLSATAFVCVLAQSDTRWWRRWTSAGAWALLLCIGLIAPWAQNSKFAQFNTLLLILVFAGWMTWRAMKAGGRHWRYAGPLCMALLILCSGVVVVRVGKLPHIQQRWKSLLTPVPESSRPRQWGDAMRPDGFIESRDPLTNSFLGPQRQIVRTGWRMLPYAGLLGLGPGTWADSYGHFTEDPLLRTFFLHVQFAHQDYVQTLVEWGVLGSVAWGIIVIGGGVRAFKACRLPARKSLPLTSAEAMMAGIFLSLGGIFLHALLDFPLQIPSIQLYVAVLLGLAWSNSPRGSDTKMQVGKAQRLCEVAEQ